MGKPKDYVDTWEGGFVRRDAEGRKVFVIRRMIDGINYKVSTRATTERAALAQLQRFETDPVNYRPGGNPEKEPVYLSADLVEEFLNWSKDKRKNSREWREKQKRFLAWWADELGDIDLKKLSVLNEITPALKGESSAQHRIAVLKSFYGWLRKEKHLISLSQDPTFETLVVPQARPAQWKKDKTIPVEHYRKARALLAAHWRDAMDVQAGTGWHISEVMRFAKNGTVETSPTKEEGVAGVLVCPQTKSGEPLRTKVSKVPLAAGKRLLKRGALGREKYGIAVKAACVKAGVSPFTPGRFRHSVATWAINKGADPASVAAFLNHRSSQTTRKFYATHATPKKVPTLV